MLILFLFKLLINTFFVILRVEAGQCSYVVLNFDRNLSLNVLINKVLIKTRVYARTSLTAFNLFLLHFVSVSIEQRVDKVLFFSAEIYFSLRCSKDTYYP